MVRRLLTSVLLAAFPALVVPIAMTSAGAQAGAAPPSADQQCKVAGWQTLIDGSGQPFGNQGECIGYFIHNITLADLAGSFSGTTAVTSGTGGCKLIEQLFDATYRGSPAVGSVTLHLDGCVSFGSPTTYAGTFTIATSFGTVSGNAAGTINNVIPPQPADFELTLTILSGTGAFAATTGTINVSIQWLGATPVTGSVTIP